MEIFLPKQADGNSQTGAPKSEWEVIEHASHTQREAIVAFETYLSKLSQKLKDISVEGSELGKRVDIIDKTVSKIEKLSEITFNLVVVGFVALIVVVIIGFGGFLFGYLQLVNDTVAKDDYKKVFYTKEETDLKAKEAATSNLQNFKNCILQNQGYWSCLK